MSAHASGMDKYKLLLLSEELKVVCDTVKNADRDALHKFILLQATAEANNLAAVSTARNSYIKAMEEVSSFLNIYDLPYTTLYQIYCWVSAILSLVPIPCQSTGGAIKSQ